MSRSVRGAVSRRPPERSDVLAAPAPKRKRLWRCGLACDCWVGISRRCAACRAWSALLFVKPLAWAIVAFDPRAMLLHVKPACVESGQDLGREIGDLALGKYFSQGLV